MKEDKKNSEPRPGPTVGNKDRDSGTIVAFPVVGVGASAGGLQAFQELLSYLPVDTGMAFVLISHLDPAHESMMATILSRSTRMPVKEVTDAMSVEANNVYVIPPNANMILSGGVLRLVPRSKVRHENIDNFMISLAQEMRSKAIGIVLSGTASDGTEGCVAIKAEGGITFAQSEASAKFPQMPKSAVAAGCIDFVLPPKAIAEELTHVSRHPYLAVSAVEEEEPPREKDEKPLAGIFRLLRKATGVDFSHYKQTTVRRRLERRMALRRMRRLEEYRRFLEENPAELGALRDEVLINVTSFFRDPEAFEALKEKVFPNILKSETARDTIRVWVAGCATGEEPYSIAMALLEFLEEKGLEIPIQIFATDVSEAAIVKARTGAYVIGIKGDVSEGRLRRFFSSTGSGVFQISKAIRDLCVFAKHDLIQDPPFSRQDLVSCRNVLIYMDPTLQERVIPAFHYALKPAGFLMLGPSESVERFTQFFEPVDKKQKLYSKVLGQVPAHLQMDTKEHVRRTEVALGKVRELHEDFEVPREVDRVILAQYVPPGVVVRDDGAIVQFRGDTSLYLRPPQGAPNFNLLKMLREGLFLDVESAFREAREKAARVRRERVQLLSEGRSREIAIDVLPVKGPGTSHPHFVIIFEEVPPPPTQEVPTGTAETETMPAGEKARELEIARLKLALAHLGEELTTSRQHQQAAVEQLETMNEELRSANEEALSSNEELQSTNEEMETAREELQSGNEELNTVNDELQIRNTELDQLNSDLTNLVGSVNLAIAIVDRNLNLRRFTSAAEKLLNIIHSDVGRRITDFKLNLKIPDLGQSISRVIETLATTEQEVEDTEGRWYSMRLRPYRTLDNKIMGVVLVWIDINEMKSALMRLREAHTLTEEIVETSRDPLLVLDAQLRVRRVNRAFEEVFRVPKQETEGRLIYDLGNRQWDIPRLRTLLMEMVPQNTSVENFEVEHDFENLGPKTMLLHARRIQSALPTEQKILLTIEDVTEQALRDKFARASALVSQTLDYASVLAGVAALAIQYFADWACVYLREDMESVRRVAVAHRDPTKVKQLEEMLDRYPADLDFGWPKTLRTGTSDLMGEIPDSALEAIARNAEHLRDLRALHLKSSMSVPLVVRDKTIGVIWMASTESGRHFGPTDLAVAEELGQRASLAIDNAAQYRRAQEAIREREQFMSIASHELKTPLTTLELQVQGLLTLAERKTSGLVLSAEHMEMLKKIERQSDRLTELINNLLDVSRITAGKLQLNAEGLDLRASVLAVAGRFEEELKRQRVELTLHTDQPAQGRWDRLRIEQVITNLLSNAIKYGNGKPITVTVQKEPSKAVLRVEDRGIGIGQEAMAKMFKPFQRFAPQGYAGLGLGLYIVRQIVDAHGGTIRVTSEVGQGSTFTVKLPLSSEAAPRESRP
jgi:two-component system CheB/CheR fusion protein